MIDINNLRNYSIHNFNRWGSKYYFWFFFILIDLRNLLYNRNKFLYVVRNLFYLIDCCINLNNFFFKSFHLLNLFLDIILWNLFEFNLILNLYSLLYLRNNLWNISFDCLFNNSLDYLSDRLNFYTLSIDINWNCSLDIYWNRNFNWLEDNSINKLNFSFLYWNSDYFINMHSDRNLLLFNYNSFFNNLMNFNISPCFKIFNQNLVSGKLNSAINCQIYNFFDLNFSWDLLL